MTFDDQRPALIDRYLRLMTLTLGDYVECIYHIGLQIKDQQDTV